MDPKIVKVVCKLAQAQTAYLGAGDYDAKSMVLEMLEAIGKMEANEKPPDALAEPSEATAAAKAAQWLYGDEPASEEAHIATRYAERLSVEPGRPTGCVDRVRDVSSTWAISLEKTLLERVEQLDRRTLRNWKKIQEIKARLANLEKQPRELQPDEGD